jgi:hypothetical protein
MQVQRLCAERGLPLVCIQPLVSHIAREQQDYTPHKTDESDCVLIGRLAAELHCYIPEELDETWAQLRHLGRRRAQLITAATASVQRIGDFLSVAWPVVTEVCAQPFKSVTWLAALQVVTGRCGGDPARLAAMGPQEFTAVVRAAVPGWGGKKGWGTICGRLPAGPRGRRARRARADAAPLAGGIPRGRPGRAGAPASLGQGNPADALRAAAADRGPGAAPPAAHDRHRAAAGGRGGPGAGLAGAGLRRGVRHRAEH